MARRHALKLRELRGVRGWLALVLAGTTAVPLLILLGVCVFILTREKMSYLNFAGLCFYGFACGTMTVAPIVLLRQLTIGAGLRIEELSLLVEQMK